MPIDCFQKTETEPRIRITETMPSLSIPLHFHPYIGRGQVFYPFDLRLRVANYCEGGINKHYAPDRNLRRGLCEFRWHQLSYWLKYGDVHQDEASLHQSVWFVSRQPAPSRPKWLVDWCYVKEQNISTYTLESGCPCLGEMDWSTNACLLIYEQRAFKAATSSILRASSIPTPKLPLGCSDKVCDANKWSRKMVRGR